MELAGLEPATSWVRPGGALDRTWAGIRLQAWLSSRVGYSMTSGGCGLIRVDAARSGQGCPASSPSPSPDFTTGRGHNAFPGAEPDSKRREASAASRSATGVG